ncbi:MAG: hypothetical protein ONB05_12015, partial [candidate division KSB1 bacterium]|nr:hypothetical protein [candidate division KSB1 bacterium]
MNYDLYAEYPCETQDDIRRIVGNIKGAHAELEDIYIKIVLLTPSVVEKVKEYAKSGHFKYGGGYKTLVYSERGPNPYSEKLIRPVLKDFEKLKLYPPKV